MSAFDKAAVATIAVCVVAVAAIGGTAGGIAGYYSGKRAAAVKVVVRSSGSGGGVFNNAGVMVRMQKAWGDLDQAEVDALTASLKTITTRKPVHIVCRDRGVCGDLALDLENAFESAQWSVSIVAPVFADAVDGIVVDDFAVHEALGRTTSLPLSGNSTIADPDTINIYLGRP